MHNKGSLVLAAIGIALLAGRVPTGQAPAAAPPFPPGFPGIAEERPVVRQFDRNGDGRLDTAERKAAREWLATQPAQAGPGPMGRRGGGGPPDGLFAGGRGGRFGGRGGFVPASRGARLVPSDVKVLPKAELYDPDTLRTLFLRFESDEWEEELEAFYNTDVEVPATLIVDGSTYRDVGVGFRGLSSYMMVPAGSKRSLNLSVDAVHEDQRIGGYRTLNLLNGNGDPTLVRTLLYSEIARQYIPTPRASYVRVAINDENWGVYVNLQQFNTDFVREWFPAGGGARWKVPGSPMGRGGMSYLGDDPAVYRSIYDIRSRDDDRSWRALIALFRTLNQTPIERLEQALSPILDIDGVLKFLALEVALVNSDGYWARASDYNLYLDERGRFHIIPHDFNEAFGTEGPGGAGGRGGGRGFPPGLPPRGALPPDFQPPPGFPAGGVFPPPFMEGGPDLDPLVGVDDTTKPLRSRLLAVPDLRRRYLAYVREIAERWLDWNRIEPLVRSYQSVIAAEVKADTRKLYGFEAFQSGVSEGEGSVKSFMERRRAYLLKER
jgi:hypothetical protein